MKHLLKLFTAFFLSFTALPISNAFSYIFYDSNMNLAEQVIASTPQMREHFMNMNIEVYAACAASSISYGAWEARGDIVLTDDEQLLWAVITTGTGLARQNLLSMGYSDDLLGDTLQYKASLIQDTNTQMIVITECASYMESLY